MIKCAIFAENEEETPWPSLQVEAGYNSDVSTVTIMAGRGFQPIMVPPPVEEVLGAIAHAVKGTTLRAFAMPSDQLLVLSPMHAQLIADAGWSKEDLRNYVFEKARLSVAEGETAGIRILPWSSKDWVEFGKNVTDKSTLVPMTERSDNLVIVVSGSTASANSTFIPCSAIRITGEIDKYKPSNWQVLIDKYQVESSYQEKGF